MNKQRHEDYLNHMIQAIDDALSYVDGLGNFANGFT